MRAKSETHPTRSWTRQLVRLTIPMLMSLLLLPMSAYAQEGGWTESFESDRLEGWELGPDVALADGALIISPGNFAARLGEFADFRLTFKARADPEAAFRLVFYARDESEYALVVFPQEMFIERHMDGPPIQLAHLEGQTLQTDQWVTFDLVVVGEDITLTVNDEMSLIAKDQNPLRPGAIVFVNIGPSEFAIDDLSFEPQLVEGVAREETEGGQPEEGPPPEEGGPPVVEQPGEGALIPPASTTTPEPAGFEGFLDRLVSRQTDTLQLTAIAINLALSALFAFLLGQAYIYWGMSLSNRRALAANFMLISVTTTFIILVVRSSVALSLGLVGALSIVRFRAAIKEPEELAYLFFAIGLGIGLGDNQRLLTLLALLVGLVLIGLGRLFRGRGADVNLHLIVASAGGSTVDLDTVLETLKGVAGRLRLQRFDENSERMEASFLIEFHNLDALQEARAQLRTLSPELEITFLDNRGIV